MLADSIIEPDTLEAADGRVRISVRMPWYRALPLSSVTGVRFALDGIPVESESIRFILNGESYALADLPDRHDRWWYVLDSAVLEGALPALDARDIHEVHVFIGLYIPYLPKADGVRAIGDQDRKSMPLKEAA